MNSTEWILNQAMAAIEQENPNAPTEEHWAILLNFAERNAKKNKNPEILIAFFRQGLRVAEEMENKHPGWTETMKSGLAASVRILQAQDQAKAGGVDSDVLEERFDKEDLS